LQEFASLRNTVYTRWSLRYSCLKLWTTCWCLLVDRGSNYSSHWHHSHHLQRHNISLWRYARSSARCHGNCLRFRI